MGCSTGSVKSQTEIWLIDPEEIVLYRKISEDVEEAFPIKGNPDMLRMRCVDETALPEWQR